MKVFDLFCAHQHTFEGWFASEDDFQQQHVRGLVQCPMCGSADIRKGLSAPRLNLHASADVPPAAQKAAPAGGGAVEPSQQALQAAWLNAARRIIAGTEDVGSRFAAEARRMHYGEIEERGIRGQATAQETAELLDEGISVMPLLLPEASKEPLQ